MNDAAENTKKGVTIYSTATCHFCVLAKDYFKAHNVPYTEYNVGIDAEKRNEMVALTGQLGVPVITIGDNTLVGFQESKIAEFLEAAGISTTPAMQQAA